MTQSDKITLQATASELLNEVGKLYSEGDGESGSSFGILNVPKPLHKYRDQIARIYKLADSLKTDMEDKL